MMKINDLVLQKVACIDITISVSSPDKKKHKSAPAFDFRKAVIIYHETLLSPLSNFDKINSVYYRISNRTV